MNATVNWIRQFESLIYFFPHSLTHSTPYNNNLLCYNVHNHSTVILQKQKKKQRWMATFIFSIVSQMLLLLRTSFFQYHLPSNIHSHNIWDVKSRQTLSDSRGCLLFLFALSGRVLVTINQCQKVGVPCQDRITTTCLSHHPFTFCIYSYVSCMLFHFFLSRTITWSFKSCTNQLTN